MPDAGDHRYFGTGYGAGHYFLVESPEVFHRAAAAPHQHHVYIGETGVEVFYRLGDFLFGTDPLHFHRSHDDVHIGIAPLKYGKDVAYGRARGGSDHGDLLRQGRDGPFAGGIEEPLGLKLFLELLEGQLQRAYAGRLYFLGHQLVLALLVVGSDIAAHAHQQAVGQVELERSGEAAEHNAGNIGGGVLEVEVGVPQRRDLEAGDLPLHPQLAKIGLEQVLDALAELADGIDPGLRHFSPRRRLRRLPISISKPWSLGS